MTVANRRTKCLTMALASIAAGVMLSSGNAYAQAADGLAVPVESIDVGAAQLPAPFAASAEMGESLRQSVASYGERTHLLQREPSQINQTMQPRSRSKWRAFWGGAVGATAGFFAGGYLGAAIDGDCGGCDDPGFKGALIGAPIGAALGGIAGALWLF